MYAAALAAVRVRVAVCCLEYGGILSDKAIMNVAVCVAGCVAVSTLNVT